MPPFQGNYTPGRAMAQPTYAKGTFGIVRPVAPVSTPGLRSTPHHAPVRTVETRQPSLSGQPPAEPGRVVVGAYSRRLPARPA